MVLLRFPTILIILLFWIGLACTTEEPADLLPQEAFSIFPETGTFGDTIRMRLTNLDPEQIDFYTILFGEEYTNIIKIEPNEISFIVPEALKSGNSSIQVIGFNFRYTSRKSFKLTPPEIISYNMCTFTEDTVKIEGKHFNPNWSRMEVFFNGEPAKLVGGNRTMLQVITPVVPFPEAKASIKLGMADYQVIGKEEICIKDKWLMVSNDAPDNFVNYTGSFVIGSKAYFLLLKDAPEQNELMVFETKTLNWESKQLEVPLLATSNVTGSSEKGYLYTQSENNNFWEYDPNIDLWTKRKKFPGKNRDFSVMFSVGKYIFLGLGNDQNTPWEPNYSDFYRYDPIQDDWEEMADLDFGPSSPKLKMACTVVGDKIILSGGGSFGVWMYDSTKNSWDRKNDFPMALSFTSGFSFNDQGFVTLGRQVWKYNFQDDSWTEVDEVGFSYRYRSFAFTIEGKAYIGGGDAIPPTIWGNPTRNVYRYDRPSF